MMQKKMIKCLLTGLFVLNLTACASNNLHVSKSLEPSLKNSNDIFLDSSIAYFMGNTDHNKLQTLVATAQPKQFNRWYSDTTGAHFEFISKEIFVNAEGQGCRDYQVKLLRGFLESPAFNYTACRDNQGIWQIIAH